MGGSPLYLSLLSVLLASSTHLPGEHAGGEETQGRDDSDGDVGRDGVSVWRAGSSRGEGLEVGGNGNTVQGVGWVVEWLFDSMPMSVSDAVGMVFERLEQGYGDDIVARVLAALSVSRVGLLEEELFALVAQTESSRDEAPSTQSGIQSTGDDPALTQTTRHLLRRGVLGLSHLRYELNRLLRAMGCLLLGARGQEVSLPPSFSLSLSRSLSLALSLAPLSVSVSVSLSLSLSGARGIWDGQ